MKKNIIILRDFRPINASELNKFMRSLVALKNEYQAYSDEQFKYKMQEHSSHEAKMNIMAAIEEAVVYGHESCSRKIISIINDLEKYYSIGLNPDIE